MNLAINKLEKEYNELKKECLAIARDYNKNKRELSEYTNELMIKRINQLNNQASELANAIEVLEGATK